MSGFLRVLQFPPTIKLTSSSPFHFLFKLYFFPSLFPLSIFIQTLFLAPFSSSNGIHTFYLVPLSSPFHFPFKLYILFLLFYLNFSSCPLVSNFPFSIQTSYFVSLVPHLTFQSCLHCIVYHFPFFIQTLYLIPLLFPFYSNCISCPFFSPLHSNFIFCPPSSPIPFKLYILPSSPPFPFKLLLLPPFSFKLSILSPCPLLPFKLYKHR